MHYLFIYLWHTQFRNADDAATALVQMNGFPLAGRPLKVGRSERSAAFPDVGETDVSAFASASSVGASPFMSDPLAAATAVAAGKLIDNTAYSAR